MKINHPVIPSTYDIRESDGTVIIRSKIEDQEYCHRFRYLGIEAGFLQKREQDISLKFASLGIHPSNIKMLIELMLGCLLGTHNSKGDIINEADGTTLQDRVNNTVYVANNLIERVNIALDPMIFIRIAALFWDYDPSEPEYNEAKSKTADIEYINKKIKYWQNSIDERTMFFFATWGDQIANTSQRLYQADFLNYLNEMNLIMTTSQDQLK